MVAPIALHVGLGRIAHPAENLDTQIGRLHRGLGRDHLEHVGLVAARQPLGLHPRHVVEQQLDQLLRGGDVGDVVLEDLEAADDPAERVTLLHVGKRVLEHPVDRAKALRADHDPLVVERRQHCVPRLAGLAEHVAIGHEHIVVSDRTAAHRPHPELGQQRGGDPRRLGIDEEHRQPVVLLGDVPVGPRQHQQPVGDFGGGGPHLGAVELPPAIDLFGESLHRAEHVGAAVGFGHRQRDAQVARRHRSQPALLLLLRADCADRLGTAERGQPPNPQQPARGARHLAREDHLGDDVAAQTAPFLGDADPEEALRLELVPDDERIVLLVRLEPAHQILGQLGIDPAPHHIAKRDLFLGEIEVHCAALHPAGQAATYPW